PSLHVALPIDDTNRAGPSDRLRRACRRWGRAGSWAIDGTENDYVSQRAAVIEERRVYQQRISGRHRARVDYDPVLGVPHDTSYYRHAEYISGPITTKSSSIHTAFIDRQQTGSAQLKREINVTVMLIGVAVTQTDHPVGVRLARGQLHIAVSGDCLGRDCPGIPAIRCVFGEVIAQNYDANRTGPSDRLRRACRRRSRAGSWAIGGTEND